MKRCWFLRQLAIRVQQQPDALALCHGEARLTYRQLWRESERVGQRLAAAGLGSEDLIGLRFPKSLDYVIAALGVWHCGAAFLPLDPGLPPARLNIIQDRALCALILDELPGDGPLAPLPHWAGPASLAYVIFTSGSSGQPKGVELTHRGLPNLFRSQIPMFRLTPRARMLWLLSIQFDASLSDLGCALLSGATLHIPTDELDLPREIARAQITHLDIPPSLLRLYRPDDLPTHLTDLIAGGEASTPAILRDWARTRHLVQVYGPTEATICTSMAIVDQGWSQARLGPPLAGIRHEVLDPQKEAAEEGELCIAGPGLARGYRGDPALTKARFFRQRGVRYYASGDRVRRLQNQDTLFLGRLDRQFKLHGKLVEPEEVEAALLREPGVERAAVVRDPQGLTAFWAGAARAQDLRRALQEILPQWMVPQRWQRMENLPQTASGKIDFAALVDARPALDRGIDSLQILEALMALQRQGLVYGPEQLLKLGPPHLKSLLESPSRPHADSLEKAGEPGRCGDFQNAENLRQLALPKLNNWLRGAAGSRADSASDGILLTGATGFLGSHLLAELLTREGGPIYCLVRRPDMLPTHPRIVPLSGDLCRPRWGLEQWQFLAENIKTIYHLAAQVHSVWPFERLRSVNFDSLEPLLELLARGDRKHLHYASTLSVFVGSDQNQGLAREDDDLSATRQVYGGYAQSKWAAEWLLRQLPPDLCQRSIYRYGLLTAHSQTGVAAAGDFLRLLGRGLVELGVFPQGHLQVDITPVDFAAKATLAAESCKTFHVANPQSASLQDIVAALKRAGHPLLEVTASEFFALSPATPEAAAAQLALCRLGDNFSSQRSLDLFQSTGIQFQVDNLRNLGFICPPPTNELLDLSLAAVKRELSA